MAARTQMILHGIPGWMIRMCQRIATWRGFVGTNLIGLAISVLGTWLTSASDINFGTTLLGTLARHWTVGVTLLGATWVLFALCALLARLPEMKQSVGQIRKEYLISVMTRREKLEIQGIPAPLICEAVALEDIFIPPLFKPYRALADQAMTEALSARLRAGMASGEVSPEVERVLIERARAYEHQSGTSVDIKTLWQRLSKQEPTAVIQGTPGMGKSTLLLRLALFMARRGQGLDDNLGGQEIGPAQVPLLISLGPYATFRQHHRASDEKRKSIRAYLHAQPEEMIELRSPETVAWLEQELSAGHCLVLFDALDEVSDPVERHAVQEAIKAFLTEVRSQANTAEHWNRFLITSRIAGYDPNAFAADHYTLAELTSQQISDFLPRWCRASARRKLGRAGLDEEQMTRQAAEIEQDLRSALEHHQGIEEMAENPC